MQKKKIPLRIRDERSKKKKKKKGKEIVVFFNYISR